MANKLHLMSPPLPAQLREFMAAKKLTQAEFQKRYQISESTLKRILDGKLGGLRAATLGKLQRLMGDKKWPGYNVGTPADFSSAVANTVAGQPSVSTEIPLAVDFQSLVSDAAYVPRNLVLFVTGYPASMPQETRDAWKALIELHVSQFSGLVSGHEVAFDQVKGCYLEVPLHMRPQMSVRERYGKPVRQLLRTYYQDHVQGRTPLQIETDGLRILAVEPSPDGNSALEAWNIGGVVFSNTGCMSASRDLKNPLPAWPYTVILFGHIRQSEADLRQADELMKELAAVSSDPR